jgi:hypothetical protein
MLYQNINRNLKSFVLIMKKKDKLLILIDKIKILWYHFHK